MDWFDQDDDDDSQNHEKEQQEQQAFHDDVDEQEDPLDAYMKSLTASSTTTTTNTSTTTSRRIGERLDMDNEDEATSHWKVLSSSSRSHNGGGRYDEDENEDNHGCHREQTGNLDTVAASRQALETTFHRAGSQTSNKKQHRGSGSGSSSGALTLERVHHEQVSYRDFAKCFWKTSDTIRGHTWRQQNDVTCIPGTIDPIVNFDDDDDDECCRNVLGPQVWSKLQARGLVQPTLVQSQTLPVAFSGHNALITAATGSGKTMAYVLPMVVHLQHQEPLALAMSSSPSKNEEGEMGPMAIVLVPTRELAMQVHKQVKSVLPSNLSSLAITGGISNYHLLKNLKQTGVHVIVATPGRFLDLLGKKKNRGLSLHRVTFVVLDEADKMLDMGFEAQVSDILTNVRPDRQSLLLSATMGKKVERVAEKWLGNHPFRIAVGRTGESSEHVDQHVMVLPSNTAKRAWLMEMLPVLSNVGRTLVFVATRTECEELAEAIRPLSLRVETLHGDKHQSDRNASLRAFAKGDLDALIATDVAARGLDVKNVSTVINFDPAKNLDAHVHRIGRAGRLSEGAHEKGVAYTLLTHKNADFAHVLLNAFEREDR